MSRVQKTVSSKNIDKNIKITKTDKPNVEEKKLTRTLIKNTKPLLIKEDIKKNTIQNVGVTKDVKAKSTTVLKTTKQLPTTKSVSTTKLLQTTKPISTTKSISTTGTTIKKVVPSRTSITSKSVDKKIKTTPIQSTKPQPIKAKPIIFTANTANIGKNNVMNRIHNVTVSSPPSQRKEVSLITSPKHIMRERTRTRTLEPHEVLVLKNVREHTERGYNSLDGMFGKSVDKNEISSDSIEYESITQIEKVKEPVAFEINFKEPKQPSSTTSKNSDKENSDDEYDDDFESYESDFESEISSKSESQQISDTEEVNSSSPSSSSSEGNIPIVRKTNEKEKKLDSGNFELHNGKTEKKYVDNNIDEVRLISEEQNDSGLEYSTGGNTSYEQKCKDTISDTDVEISVSVMSFQPENIKNKFNQKSLSSRGRDLIEKISLDIMTFYLFELKPMTYEYYMNVYGHNNSMQNSTQTNEDTIEQDTQTDTQMSSTVWTQFPPQFTRNGLNKIMDKIYYDERNGVGRDNDNEVTNLLGDEKDSILEKSIKFVEKLSNENSRNNLKNSGKSIDYHRLNVLLQRTAITISDILNKSSRMSSLKKSSLNISQGYFSLNLSHDFLINSKITQVYSDVNISNILLTLHDVSNDKNLDYENIICVWNILDPLVPIKILSSWCKISCLGINSNVPELIFGGMTDGSISAWDMNESSFWHPIINKWTFRVSSQIVMPEKKSDNNILDYGKLISIRSVNRNQSAVVVGAGMLSAYNPIQICTLHEIGIITIWTILDIKVTDIDTGQITKRVINSSPWSRIKLVQSYMLELVTQLNGQKKTKTTFEKTRFYFENDIFNDDALKELQTNTNSDKTKELLTQNIRFTDFEVTSEGFFISTNKNYIFYCTKSMKLEHFKKIIIDDGNFLFASTLKLFSNEKFLLVGLSDGSLKIYSCSVERPTETQFDSDQIALKQSATVDSSQQDVSLILSKSCTIQNIIKNERPIYDETQALNNLDSIEIKNRLTFITELKQKQNKLNGLINNQVLLRGFTLKGNNIKNIQVTKDGTMLFAVVANELKCYDLIKNEEFCISETISADDICLTENEIGRKHLMILSNDEMQIHQLKNFIE